MTAGATAASTRREAERIAPNAPRRRMWAPGRREPERAWAPDPGEPERGAR
jgi:hypothetical protein